MNSLASSEFAPLKAFLDAQSIVTVSVSGQDGLWSAPVLYATGSALNLYFLSAPSSRHTSDCTKARHVSAAVYADYRGRWQSICGVQMQASLSPVNEKEITAVETLYFRRFPEVKQVIDNPSDEEEKKIGSAFAKSRFYTLTPKQVRFIDNSRGFASRNDWQF